MDRPAPLLIIARLPLDLVKLIASFIPFHPRLRVLSLLSRRWRTAVLGSVTHLPLYTTCSGVTCLPLAARPLFSGLEAININSSQAEGWSAPIRELILFANLTDCCCQELNWLTSLTSLRINFQASYITKQGQLSTLCAYYIAARNAASLNCLNISEAQVPYTLFPEFRSFFELRYPLLTNLNVSANLSTWDPITVLLASHSSQLKTLKLTHLYQQQPCQWLLNNPFLSLTSLSLYCDKLRHTTSLDPLVAVVRKLVPKLQVCKLRLDPTLAASVEIIGLASPVLRSLRLYPSDSEAYWHRDMWSVLNTCHCLVSLKQAKAVDSRWALSSYLAPRMQKLAPQGHATRFYPSLRSLDFPDVRQLLATSFPFATTACLKVSRTKFPSVMSAVHKLLVCAPHVRHLKIIFIDFQPWDWAELLSKASAWFRALVEDTFLASITFVDFVLSMAESDQMNKSLCRQSDWLHAIVEVRKFV